MEVSGYPVLSDRILREKEPRSEWTWGNESDVNTATCLLSCIHHTWIFLYRKLTLTLVQGRVTKSLAKSLCNGMQLRPGNVKIIQICSTRQNHDEKQR